MKSYEIVRAALHYKNPPRFPVRFACFGCDDFAWIPQNKPDPFDNEGDGLDEWSCKWSRTEVANMGQVTGHPLENLSDLSKITVPDFDNDARWVEADSSIEQFQKDGKFVSIDIFMVLFERMHSLYGFENTLCGLITETDAMARLADLITDAHVTLVESAARRFGDAIHGVTMTDDWGTQQAAFIGLDMWMEFFYPRYKRLFDCMHKAGYDVMLHSCGKVNELIEGFIRAGVDSVNLQQPRALGIREVGERYRGRVTFNSLADIQATLPTGDRSKVDADVEELVEYWASPDGGFIFSDYGDNEAIGITDPDIKLYMYNKFSEASRKLYGNPLPEPKQTP